MIGQMILKNLIYLILHCGLLLLPLSALAAKDKLRCNDSYTQEKYDNLHQQIEENTDIDLVNM